ncbi:MAG: hypothetical protein N3A55_10155 [Methylohalobius sp.]|nr:hypothetical protein [Methylohalobius sp.]
MKLWPSIKASQHELIVAGITFSGIALCLYLDSLHDLELQNALGECAWVVLFGLLIWESSLVRLQVLIAVAFATLGEHFASGLMQGYIYYFHNIPAYVPPGHGLVYLTAVALARAPIFQALQRPILWGVLAIMGSWSLWGVTLTERSDWIGAILFLAYIFCVLRGRAPLVYLAAFFVTTHLELIGTALGTWTWVTLDPILSLPQGNPPSGVAAWYCLVDAVAIGGATWISGQQRNVRKLPARIRKPLAFPAKVEITTGDS